MSEDGSTPATPPMRAHGAGVVSSSDPVRRATASSNPASGGSASRTAAAADRSS